jgi:riboflavin synthase
MFTGIIQQTGRIVSLNEHGGIQRLTVAAPGIAGQLREGDSLAVSGVCLTALDVNPELFHADLAAETLARTSLGQLSPGALVNLELPTAAGSPLGGHIVQGHVDGVGTLVSLTPVAPQSGSGPIPDSTDWWLTLRVPESVRPYMVEKGSVAIEGISLTIAHTEIPSGGDTIGIAILPLTYSRTNLNALKPGSPVNVEADVLLKYAALQSQTKEEQAHPGEAFALTEAWLVASGY